MRFKQCFALTLSLVGLLSYAVPPSRAQDLNAQLRQAMCSEDWGNAIAIVNRMMQRRPDYTPQLQQYRDRLQQLQQSSTPLPADWHAQYCSQRTAPTSTPTSNLSERIEQYYEQMEGMSYAELKALVGHSGQETNRYFAYTWQREDGATLTAEFPNHQVMGLFTIAGMDCSESNATDNSLSIKCHSLPLPPEFERIEIGMSEQQVLQHLGQPTERQEIVEYEWRFQEGETFCLLGASFRNNKVNGQWKSCGG
jgi:hypothetical protein